MLEHMLMIQKTIKPLIIFSLWLSEKVIILELNAAEPCIIKFVPYLLIPVNLIEKRTLQSHKGAFQIMD